MHKKHTHITYTHTVQRERNANTNTHVRSMKVMYLLLNNHHVPAYSRSFIPHEYMILFTFDHLYASVVWIPNT